MDRIQARQRKHNVESEDRWERFTVHRQQTMQAILGSDDAVAEAVCILGAGNCNDLDLAKLASQFSTVHLVDLDGRAMQQAIDRQGCAGASVMAHEHDVSGLNRVFADWSPERTPSEAAVAEALRTASTAPPPSLAQPADVVVSDCLLTQLFDALLTSLDPRHPRYMELLFQIRSRHLQHLLQLTRPGGRALLITDFVSSDTCPQLAQIAPAELPSLIPSLLAARNFFSGVNPAVLVSLFEREAPLREQVASTTPLAPWLWDFGPRTYAVFAIEVVKLGGLI